MAIYKVTHTAPAVYADKGGKPVRGFVVTVLLTQFDEQHEVYVPSLDPKVVREAIAVLYNDRAALDDLGE